MSHDRRTRKQLYEQARRLQVPHASKLRKHELLAAITERSARRDTVDEEVLFHAASSDLDQTMLSKLRRNHAQCFPTQTDPAFDGHVFWLEHDDDVVSELVVDTHDAYMMMWNVCTALRHQRRGYAERLIRYAQRWWLRSRYAVSETPLYLNVLIDNVGAQKLYEKVGFRPNIHHTTGPEPAADSLIMVWNK